MFTGCDSKNLHPGLVLEDKCETWDFSFTNFVFSLAGCGSPLGALLFIISLVVVTVLCGNLWAAPGGECSAPGSRQEQHGLTVLPGKADSNPGRPP